MTQSPLSRRIQSLEARLGFALFTREKKRLTLTGAGREFLQEARGLLTLAEAASKRARSIADGRGGALSVGYVGGALFGGLLGQAIALFRSRAPDAELTLRPMRTRAQIKALETGEIDLGVGHSPPAPQGDLVSVKLRDESFVIAAPKEEWRGRAPSAEDLDGAAFIDLPVADYPLAREALFAACAEAGFRPEIRSEAVELPGALALVAAGLGCALVQESAARLSTPGVAMHPAPPGFAARLSIHATFRQEAAPVTRRFSEALKQASASMAP